MVEFLSYDFIQFSLIVVAIIGFVSSFFGVFVVQRQMSFLGSGLAHSAFGGVALGLLLGVEPLFVALAFTMIVGLLIPVIQERTKLASDTSIGIMFAFSMALGILFLSFKDDFTTDAFNYLFGSILAINKQDIYISVILLVITIYSFFSFWSRWAYATFDVELAESDKLNVRRDNYVLSILIALTIVISIKLVGIVLISAFLVIPAAAARLVSGTFYKMSVMSVIFGVVSALFGLVLSYYLDIPSGASIIIVQIGIFLVCYGLNKALSLDV